MLPGILTRQEESGRQYITIVMVNTLSCILLTTIKLYSFNIIIVHMHSVQVSKANGPFEIVDRNIPEPGEGQVLQSSSLRHLSW